MTNLRTSNNSWRAFLPILILALSVGGGCSSQAADQEAAAAAGQALPDSASCRMALLPHAGSSGLDKEIRKLQTKVSETALPWQGMERLGWLFVSKARSDYDPGFYTQALAGARCLEEAVGEKEHPPAMLLRGHVLHSLHQFEAAQGLAERLVELRGLPYDFGLLGDVLQEQGKVDQAAQAYQRMLDLKPGPKAYSRAAHLRWLKGDLKGATELMAAAASAGTRDSEASAWAFSRLSWYQLQAGEEEAALRSARTAESLQPGYAPALLARGRLRLAQGDPQAALQPLQEAARLNPLPEYQWILADTLKLLGEDGQASEVEARLRRKGPLEDPRTASLFLATRGRENGQALPLAQEELEARQDIFTYDALAWALYSAGRFQEARETMQEALVLGTRDARLYLHAGLIWTRAGQPAEASRWLSRADEMRHTLLPSEATLLDAALNPLQP